MFLVLKVSATRLNMKQDLTSVTTRVSSLIKNYDLHVRNVIFRHGDGFAGMEDFAPYDGILAAAVSEDGPQELVDQLAEGGRLVMPVGKGEQQALVVIDKTPNGLRQQTIEAVRFVPRLAGLG